MLTKYEEEEKNEKQNDDAIGFSSVVMGEPVEIHVDDARTITINPDLDIWQRYVNPWIVTRPDEPDIIDEERVREEVREAEEREASGNFPF